MHIKNSLQQARVNKKVNSNRIIPFSCQTDICH